MNPDLELQRPVPGTPARTGSEAAPIWAGLAKPALLASDLICLWLVAHALAWLAAQPAVAGAAGAAAPQLAAAPWVWLVAAGLLAWGVRGVAALGQQRLRQRGALAETVVVVGHGSAALRLVQRIESAGNSPFLLLGHFDDRPGAALDATTEPASDPIADLIRLGQQRRIDWVVLALPPDSAARQAALVQRLRALPARIAVLPLEAQVDAPALAPDGAAESPGWFDAGSTAAPRAPLELTFDAHDLASFGALAAGFGQRRHGYVVTPNADHLIRLGDSAPFRALYRDADFILLDSRFLAHVLRLSQGLRLPVCTGSDLTAHLLGEVAAADDGLVLIGASAAQAQQLARRYGLRRLAHHNPPMGFIHAPDQVEAALRFVEAHSPFRFCLLAVGSPQQEVLAQALQQRGVARGLTLCVGASIDFLTGDERRAPRWLQRGGFEWAYRLAQSPLRLARRYLVRGPRVFGLLRRARIVLRPARPWAMAAPLPAPLLAPASVSMAHTGFFPGLVASGIQRSQPGSSRPSGSKR